MMQESLLKINNKIQNYSPKSSIVVAIPNISVELDFMTYQ
jgi:hypothetical protein